jgi:hypothetical protein
MRYQKTVLAVVLVLAGISSPPAHAQQVHLKRPFFRGWRYAIDTAEYRRLGSSAAPLRPVMKDYRVCISALNSYRTHATAAKITGLTSAFLVSIPLVSQIRGKEWIDGYTSLMIVGGGIAVISLLLDRAGSNSLKRAARLYNRYAGYSGLDPPESWEIDGGPSGVGMTVGLRF